MDSVLRRQLELAGMPTSVGATDLTTETVLVPHHVKISNEAIVYDFRDCERKTVRGAAKLLESFISLKTDEHILRFASRYGVLELDEANGYRPAQDRKMIDALWGMGEYPKIGREPLQRWRYYSRVFGALLAISAKLHQGKAGDPDEWKILEPNYEHAFRITDQKLLVGMVIDEFILQSNLRPVLKWSGDNAANPGIVFGSFLGGGLFAVLVFHLMLAITGLDGLAICGSCQRSFTPAARARRGNTRFCDACRRDGSAHRVAERNYENRKKELLKDTAIIQRNDREGRWESVSRKRT